MHWYVKCAIAEVLKNEIFNVFRFAVLCTKHPGFVEEREWRVIYLPRFEHSERLIKEIVSIKGTPQMIHKIPLKNIPEEGLVGVEIPEIVDRIIIGPTKYPIAIYDAFVTLLGEAGVEDAKSRIFISDIPLRQ